ncbi:hypothetical protein ACLOJK_035400 [Asimina triloba]
MPTVSVAVLAELKMSSGFGISNDYPAAIDELLDIATMCRELRKEKNILREALLREQSKSAEMIRRLDSDLKALTDARVKDQKYISGLERELRNCSQEIEYLQDQLNVRNVEANCLGEHVHRLELKLSEVVKLHEEVCRLREELAKSDSECLFLAQTLEEKENELQNSISHAEKLEAEVSSIALESQCEIESLKLDQTALEQKFTEATKFNEQAAQEKGSMSALIDEFKAWFKEVEQIIDCLNENKEFEEKMEAYDKSSNIFLKFKEHLEKWPMKNSDSASYSTICLKLTPSRTVAAAWDENLKDEMEKMMHHIHESELLIKQLKEDLIKEKSRAKEEAEDLTQEMAELRYQITEMLEQECKRRACIEQASLQRISELEAQVHKEQRKNIVAIHHLHEAQNLAKSRSVEVNHLKEALALQMLPCKIFDENVP